MKIAAMNHRQAEIYADTEMIVKKRGGTLLESSYVNSKSPLLVECPNGHQWKSNREALKAGNWCPRCAGRGRSREDIVIAVRKRGGDLLSESFTTMPSHYRWRCELGHEWVATANNVINHGRWCPECGRRKSDAGRRRYTLNDLQKWARMKEGECLATEFTSVIAKVPWRCGCGFEWEAEARRVRDGGWCPECAKIICGQKRRVHTPDSLREFAQAKDGECYPPEYFDVKTPVEWACSAGHRWLANADNVINGGKWCSDCAGNKKLNIEDMQILARSRHGNCISSEYVNSQTSLEWACAAGHKWSAVPNSIMAGGWCPACSAGLGERICREHFEQLLGEKFSKTRPLWLRSSEGNQLELDGFSPELALAFEHQGSQHYKKVDRFHKTRSSFEAQLARDAQKRKLCKENGVDLIEVPSVLEILSISALASFIVQELTKLGRIVPEGFSVCDINYSEAYKPDEIAALQDVSSRRGGELISTTYLGIFEKLKWRCSKGHEFFAAPNNVKNSSSWCPTCVGRGQSISDMKIIAGKKGGDCLSSVYVDSKTPLLWKCAEGHTWEARPSNVKFRTWCPKCALKQRGLKRRKYNLISLQAAAIQHGGTCESAEYLGYKVKHRWKCTCGTKFERTAENVLKKSCWCPKCKRRKRS